MNGGIGGMVVPNKIVAVQKLPAILLIEKEPITAKLMIRQMRNSGLGTATHVLSGAEALAQVQKTDFDLFIMGSSVPYVKGRTKLACELKLNYPNINIISVSTINLDDIRKEVAAAGVPDLFKAYIITPYDEQVLVRAVAQYVRQN
ncbi:Response regulator receiver domain protein [uncultured archaeon]|nr:Response regulator receiver domain protein [uncultured archaeon]